MLFSLFSMFFWGKLQDLVALCPCLCSRFPTWFHLSLCCPSAGIQLRSQVNFFQSPLHIFINFKLTHKLEIVEHVLVVLAIYKENNVRTECKTKLNSPFARGRYLFISLHNHQQYEVSHRHSNGCKII